MTFDAEDDHAADPERIPVHAVAGLGGGVHGEAIDRRSSAVGRHLDVYLAAVVRELHMRGVIAAPPQRTDPAQRLLGSIVLDCSAVGVNAGNTRDDQPVPVVVTWDEYAGWCVGLHHDSTHSTRRYLHPDLLPAPAIVAEFVLALAQGCDVGAAYPFNTSAPRESRLRLIR
jgi:hypothetical protein